MAPMERRTGLLALAGLAAGCALPPRGEATGLTRLAMGVQSTRLDETRAAWQPLVDDLGRVLGLPSELVVGNQTDTVRALASGRVDVVWLSSSAAIDAAIDANARAFAVYQNVNGTQGYKAVLVVRRDSGIRTLDEALVPGRWRYAAGAKTSTSGYVLPQHFLFAPRNTTAEALFKSVRYGGHFPNLDALWAREVDVAINNTTDLAMFQARTPGAPEQLVTLWESPLVPNDVLMVRADMPPAAKRRMAALFLGYGSEPRQRELLRQASGISHFVAADNRLLAPVAPLKFATENTPAERRQRWERALQDLR